MSRRPRHEDARCTRCGAESAWIEGTPKGAPSCDCAEVVAENDRLRAELDDAKAMILGHEKGIAALGALIDSLRAALAKEREAALREAFAAFDADLLLGVLWRSRTYLNPCSDKECGDSTWDHDCDAKFGVKCESAAHVTLDGMRPAARRAAEAEDQPR